MESGGGDLLDGGGSVDIFISVALVDRTLPRPGLILDFVGAAADGNARILPRPSSSARGPNG